MTWASPKASRPSSSPIVGAAGPRYGAATHGAARGAVGPVPGFDPPARQPAAHATSQCCHHESDICFSPLDATADHAADVTWNPADLTDGAASGSWVGRKPPPGRLPAVPLRRGACT